MFGLLTLPLVAAALALFTNIFTILTPLFEGVSKLFVWFVETLWSGVKTIANNLSTLSVILVLCLASAHYGQTLNDEKIVKPYKQDIVILEKAFANKKTKKEALPKKINGHYYKPALKNWLGL